jgi:hypothetical protein
MITSSELPALLSSASAGPFSRAIWFCLKVGCPKTLWLIISFTTVPQVLSSFLYASLVKSLFSSIPNFWMLDQLPLLNVFDLGLQQIQGLRQQLWPRLPPAIQTSALGPSNGGGLPQLEYPQKHRSCWQQSNFCRFEIPQPKDAHKSWLVKDGKGRTEV